MNIRPVKTNIPNDNIVGFIYPMFTVKALLRYIFLKKIVFDGYFELDITKQDDFIKHTIKII